MPRVSETAPPRLLGSDVDLLSFEPKIAKLELETDDGQLVILINRKTAAWLAGTLLDFLAAHPDDQEEDAANDR